ncbi:hypothetical protein CHU98_g2125 [Xylaria longipes]|nr:hypothetical protein CHU98_g2125 [Xylaria longipes]
MAIVGLEAAERVDGVWASHCDDLRWGTSTVWMHPSEALIGCAAQVVDQSALTDRGVVEEAMVGGTHQLAGPHHL